MLSQIIQYGKISLKKRFGASSPIVVNLYRHDRHNIGDMMSAPCRYFDFGNVIDLEIMDIRKHGHLLENDIIIGGGGLLAREYFEQELFYIARNAKRKMISWGVGHNAYEDQHGPLQYPAYMDRFDLHGIRDYNQGFNYVPCASCMHPLFDHSYTISRDIVIYEHASRPLSISEPFPRMQNNGRDLRSILKFLGSADTILTNTFHGAYWGLLLGRKVIANSWSTKFTTLKYPLMLVPGLEEWRSALTKARAYPEALPESRSFNQTYYQQVMDRLRT